MGDDERQIQLELREVTELRDWDVNGLPEPTDGSFVPQSERRGGRTMIAAARRAQARVRSKGRRV